MNYRKVESYAAERPLELDETSSKSTVYLRKNITEIQNDEGDGKHWQMDELRMTKDEYDNYKRSQEIAEIVNEASSAQAEELMQALSDAEVDRELKAIDATTDTETIMQTLSDIQADIAMISLTE